MQTREAEKICVGFIILNNPFSYYNPRHFLRFGGSTRTISLIKSATAVIKTNNPPGSKVTNNNAPIVIPSKNPDIKHSL